MSSESDNAVVGEFYSIGNAKVMYLGSIAESELLPSGIVDVAKKIPTLGGFAFLEMSSNSAVLVATEKEPINQNGELRHGGLTGAEHYPENGLGSHTFRELENIFLNQLEATTQ